MCLYKSFAQFSCRHQAQRDVIILSAEEIVQPIRCVSACVTMYTASPAAFYAQVEMYADPVARGGVLEPEGIVEIKFRAPDLIKAMHRLDPVIARIKAEDGPDVEAVLRAREGVLLPVYRQVSNCL